MDSLRGLDSVRMVWLQVTHLVLVRASSDLWRLCERSP